MNNRDHLVGRPTREVEKAERGGGGGWGLEKEEEFGQERRAY